ncbi:MAG TPA: hypothetical protein VID48_11875 [Solirubrobacteraceae bacterium]|jgi:hypothetical protein
MRQPALHFTDIRPIEYDALHRRLWIAGQRCHHGASGMLLTCAAVIGARAGALKPKSGAALAASGALLMAHDWKDHSLWFEPGHGHQP